MRTLESLPCDTAGDPALAAKVFIPQLHVRELQAFLAAAEAGTFQEAGRRLFLDASTVSKLVSRMERRLEQQLVARTTRGVNLTPAGVAALDPVRVALEAVNDLGLLMNSTGPRLVR